MSALKSQRLRHTVPGEDGEIQNLEALLGESAQSYETTDQQTIYCIHCGTANPAHANYCARCGQVMINPENVTDIGKRKRIVRLAANSSLSPEPISLNLQARHDTFTWLSRIVTGLGSLIVVLISSGYFSAPKIAHWAPLLASIPLMAAGMVVVERRRRKARPLDSKMKYIVKFILEIFGTLLLLITTLTNLLVSPGTALVAIVLWLIAEALLHS